jgi:hypothetical protein
MLSESLHKRVHTFGIKCGSHLKKKKHAPDIRNG